MSLIGIWAIVATLCALSVASSMWGDLVQRDMMNQIICYLDVGLCVSISAMVSAAAKRWGSAKQDIQ